MPRPHPLEIAPHCLIAVLLLLVAACSGTSSTEEILAKAQAAMAEGDLPAAIIHYKNALLRDPDNRQARFELGTAHLEAGDLLSAEKEFERVAAREAELAPARLKVYEIWSKLGRHADVLAKIGPDARGFDARLLRAAALTGSGDALAAEALLGELLAEDPRHPEVHKGLAALAFHAGDLGRAGATIDEALSLAPHDLEAWLAKAEIQRAEGRLEESVATYKRAIEEDRFTLSGNALRAHAGAAAAYLALGDANGALVHVEHLARTAGYARLLYHYLKGSAQYSLGDVDGAVLELRLVIKQQPKHAPSLLLLGAIEAKRENLNLAEEYLQRHVANAPHSVIGRKMLAQLYLRRNRPVEAVSILTPAAATAGTDVEFLELLSTAYINSGQVAEASAMLTRVLENRAEEGPLRTKLAVAHMLQGDNAAAQRELTEQIESARDPAYSKYLLAVTELREQNVERAIEIAGEIVAADPADGLAHNLLGVAYKLKGRDAEAIAAFREAWAADPSNESAALNLAELHIRSGDADAARAIFQTLLDADPSSTRTLLALARLHQSAGQTGALIDVLEKVRSLDPRELESRVLLAQHRLAERKFAESRILAEEAVAIAPGDPRGHFSLARARMELGELERALDAASKVVELIPEDPLAVHLLASVYLRLGQFEEAKKLLGKVLARHADFAPAKLALAQLEGAAFTPGASGPATGEGAAESAPSIVDYMIAVQHLIQAGKFDEALAQAREMTDAHPRDINGLILHAGAARASGDARHARELLQRALAIDPDNTAVLMNVADLEYRTDNLPQARAVLEKILELNPSHLQAQLLMAELEPPENEVRLLEKVRADHPQAIGPMVRLAEIHLIRQAPGEALKLARQAYAIVQADEGVASVYVRALLASGDLAAANEVADRFVTLLPDSTEGHMVRGLARAARGDEEEARAAFEAAVQRRPGVPRMVIPAARFELLSGQPRRALELVQALPPELQALPQIAILKADALWRSGERGEAITLYRRSWEADRSAIHAGKLARALWAEGATAEARSLLEGWIADNPGDTGSRIFLGDFAYTSGDLDAAAAVYRKVLDQEPNHLEALLRLSIVYGDQNDQRAIDMARRAYKLAPASPNVADAYGWLLVQRGEHQQGLEVLVKGVDRLDLLASEADRATYRYHLAEAYRKSGDTRAARKELEAILATSVDFPERDFAERLLDGLN